jgi:Domain of unknown function (DUF5916)
MKSKSTICSAFLLLLNHYLFSQAIFPPDPIKRKLEAAKIENNLKIDGKLDEGEWLLTRPVGDFIQTDPKQGVLAKKRTVVKLLYNKNYLYVAAICYDTVGRSKYRVLNMKRDFNASTSDFFALAIDGYNDERNCVMFGTNPYGAQRDLLSFDDNYYDPDWDGLWRVRTQRTDTAWIAEAALPWKTLRYKNNPDSLQTWGISFGRIARSINEFSNWPAFPRAYGGLRMPYAGKLVNLQAPKPSANFRIQPYFLYSFNETKENSTTLDSKSNVKPGGEIKWAINPNTLLDVTFNTDFAQADVDRKVNNVNRFSVFFPEKRQFFLENAGLFAVGLDPLGNNLNDYSARIQPFFSRTIGLDATGSPLTIDAGARLVHRSARINFGGLFVRQEGNANTNSANLMMGRYSQNIGKQNRIGTLFSYKVEDASTANATKNFTGTLDGFFRFSQALSGSFMGSMTNDLKSKTGYAASSQLRYNTNKWVAWWNQSIVTSEYNPQMGFVARGNTIVSDPGLYLQERGKWLPRFIRAYQPGIALTTYHNATSLALTDRYINLNPVWFQFQHGGIFSYNIILTRQNLENDFHPLDVTISKGSYDYTRHKISISSDPSKKISAALIGNLGQFYDGRYNSLTTTVSFAPSPHLFISPNIEFGKLEKVGVDQAIENVTLYTIEGRLALNPRVQLTGLLQRSSVTNSIGYNVRFAWEYKPLSYFYVVFNSNSVSQATEAVNQQVIAKISYLKQF